MDSSCKPLEEGPEAGVENGKGVEPPGQQEAPAGGCSWSRVLPPEYRRELTELSKLAGPVVSAWLHLQVCCVPRLCKGQTVLRLSRRP